MRQKISKQTKMREVLQKKLHQLEEQKADVEVERDTLKVQIPALEKGTPRRTGHFKAMASFITADKY